MLETGLLRPADAAELAEIVAHAAAQGQTLEIRGGGSKRDFGRPVEAARVLDLSRLRGVVDYEPAELVLTGKAATPLDEIRAALEANGQMLAFEPPDWGALLPGGGAPTLGGIVACNMAGPRRVRAGSARDHFLGFAAVNGRGEAWKAGGKVVKNVTGYDMCKLQAGAFGTLSVLTELSVKVLPKPETSCSVAYFGLTDIEAIRALAAALNTPHEVSAAAHLPARVAARSSVAASFPAGQPVTVLRLEGPLPSVAFRAAGLQDVHTPNVRLDAPASLALWAEIAAVQPLLASADSEIWRVCATPSAAPLVLGEVRKAFADAGAFYDWGGGLLWIELDPVQSADAGAGVVRAALGGAGGHATLIRATPSLRRTVPVFQPGEAALEALTRRVKAGFDPLGILNPGRMQQGV